MFFIIFATNTNKSYETGQSYIFGLFTGIACFLVMMVHASEAFYGVGDVPILSDAHKFWIAIWDGMSRISVPLFVITSAYLLVPMKEKQSWGRVL